MSKVRILIIEDELLVAEEMAGMLTSNGYQVCESVDNAMDARRALEMYQLDIILVDIKIRGEEDGISLAGYIHSNYSIPLIFVTSMMDDPTLQRALQVKPSAYLIKPYHSHELQIAIEVALSNFQHQQVADYVRPVQNSQSHYTLKQSVFIRENHRLERIEYDDILWMKAESSYVDIVTPDKHYLLSTDTLGSMLEKLNCRWLLRVHRSYAVNVNKVTALSGNQLEVAGQTVPIGKNYRAMVKQFFQVL
ncbi:response regulator transcription factor [Fulvivirga sp. M361]|uniref:LytR/AlgR family response regulator transcription factor n=1 Tax=Fulvivirga sp. M361 TaxID=2594266 RepID=UPI001179DF04|nr:response regulator [Fulvivirga sp. M361]TRX48392.1 response regulator transcription factor [Fulvivirga sp. M361]